MNRFAMGVEYDGSQFHGWQRQKTVPSVQEEIEKAISIVAAEPIEITCAGRTDRGVHATAQVIHFDSTRNRLERAWVFGTNNNLNKAIRILWCHPVSSDFNARRSATARRYQYIIYNHAIRPSLFRNQVGWYYRKLDIETMQEASQYWIGTHDFSSFRAAGCQSHSPVREVTKIQIERHSNSHLITINITANAFLHHMVRNMVGVLKEIGSGKAESIWAKEVLLACDRRSAGMTASAKGLYLAEVYYPEQFKIPQFQARNVLFTI